MIKALLFDFDGVLTLDKTGSTSITNYIAAQTGLPLELVRQSYYPFNHALLYGQTTHEEIWPLFCQNLGQALDYRLLTDSFTNTPLDMRMLELLARLKPAYRLGLVTDNKCDRMDAVLQQPSLSSLFDAVAVSAQVKSGKDRPEIFRYVLDRLYVQAAECVFIDNTAKNLIVPESLGMRTILFDDTTHDVSLFERQLMSLLHP